MFGGDVRPTHRDSDRFRQIADPFSKTSRFWTLFTQWVCTLATTPPQLAAPPPPNGGNCIIRAATRRRYSASQLLMLQNPHRFPCGEQRRGRMARLRCPWAPEGPEGTGELQNAGPGRGAGGRWRGQGGPRDRPLRAAGSRVAISRAGRRPPAHTAARPSKASHAAPRTPVGQQATSSGLKDKKSWWRVSPSCFGGGLCGGGRARRWRRPIWG